MSEGTFDLLVRAVACTSCGAPLKLAAEGGTITCEFCDTTNLVHTRPQEAEHARPSAAEEVARLARLAQQNEAKVQNPFDMSSPPEGLRVETSDDRLRAELGRITAKPSEDLLASDERAVCWIASNLATRASRAGEPLRARAQLEGALNHLPDAGYRHLVRARLAVLAARAGELDAAEAWLAGCDPAPEVLTLDTVYRLARVELDLHAGRHDAARERLGEGSGVPLDDTYAQDTAMLRMVLAWHEGEHAKAYEMLDLRATLDEPYLAQLRTSDLAPGLVDDYEATQATIRERMVWAVPVSWLFVVLTIGLGVVLAMLQSDATLSPTATALGYGAALVPLTLGFTLAVGMRQRKGGLWWLGLIGTAVTLIPVAGVIIILIFAPLLSSETSTAKRRANLPATLGLVFGGLILLGLRILGTE